MPTNGTLIDVSLLDEPEKVLQSPLVSANAAKWLRANRRLLGVIRLKTKKSVKKVDGNDAQIQHAHYTLPGFRSEVGRMLGRNDVEWILDRQVWWARHAI